MKVDSHDESEANLVNINDVEDKIVMLHSGPLPSQLSVEDFREKFDSNGTYINPYRTRDTKSIL